MVPTVREAAVSVHDEHCAPGSGKHQQQWISRLEPDALLAFGNRPVNEIDGPAIHDVVTATSVSPSVRTTGGTAPPVIASRNLSQLSYCR